MTSKLIIMTEWRIMNDDSNVSYEHKHWGWNRMTFDSFFFILIL